LSPIPKRTPAADPTSKEQKRFARADKNEDGRITLAELVEPRREAFAKLDVNSDGRLSFEEWAVRTIDNVPGRRCGSQQMARACRICHDGAQAEEEAGVQLWIIPPQTWLGRGTIEDGGGVDAAAREKNETDAESPCSQAQHDLA
jgi:hypothetical protein